MAACFPVAPASAKFDPPFEVSGPSSAQPQVALDRRGRALLVWWRGEAGSHNRVELRTRSAAGVLGETQMISRADQNAVSARMAMNAAGRAAIAWQAQFEIPNSVPILRMQVRTRSTGGALGDILTISPSRRSAGNPQIAMNANGDAMIVWERSDGSHQRIEGRGLSAAGVLGPVKTLSPPGFNAFLPKVATRSDGTALVVWHRDDAEAFYRVEARTQSLTGALGNLQRISERGELASHAEVAMNGAGAAFFVWNGSDGTHQQVHARSRSPTGVLGQIDRSPGGTHTAAPSVAMLPNGDALIAWLRMAGGPHFRVQTLTRSAAGVYGPPQTLSGTGQHAGVPRIAMNGVGNAVIVWRRSDGTRNRIQARSRAAGGKLGQLQTTSRRGRNADLPQVAIDVDGTALAAWSQTDLEGTATTEAAAGP